MNSFQPIHAQIKDFLLSQIKSGRYKPGGRLPTEQELTQEFQTSKSPVRQALDALRVEGYIYRHPGRGTFVSSAPRGEANWTIGSIEDVIGLGEKTKFHLLDFAPCPASEELLRVFNVKGEKTFFRIQGVRLLDDKPLYYLDFYLRKRVARQLQKRDVLNSPVIVALEKKLHLRLSKCVQIISASLADSKLSRYLKIPNKSPILCIERVYYTYNDEVIQWARSFWRADLTKHRSILSRK